MTKLTEIPNNGIKKINWSFFFQLQNTLKKVIDESSYHPDIKNFADKITTGTNHDIEAKIYTIADYINSRYSFNRDPEGREYLILPTKLVKMLNAGEQISGDCDDVTVLLCSLYKSIGLKTYMVFISPLLEPPFTHVLCAVKDDLGESHLIDLVNKEKLLEIGRVKIVKV